MTIMVMMLVIVLLSRAIIAQGSIRVLYRPVRQVDMIVMVFIDREPDTCPRPEERLIVVVLAHI